MGRPVDIDKRRALARRAAEALMEGGLDMSNARLAAALGIKRPTLLYHFPNRAAIVEAALEDLLQRQSVYVLSKMFEHDHPLRQLHAQVKAIHAFHHGQEERVLFLSMSIAALGREHAERMIAVGNQVFELQRRAMAERLRAAIDEGRMHPCDPIALLQLVRAMNDGLVVQRVMTGCDLAPVHQFLWDHVLGPLMKEEQ